jgi:hypothetical protein
MQQVNPIDVIQLIESQFDVSLLKYKGILFWPIVRRELLLDLTYNTTSNAAFRYDSKPNEKTFFNVAKHTLYNFIYTLRKYPIPVSIFFHGYPEGSYKKGNDDLHYNQYIDPYFELISKYVNCKKFALSSSMPTGSIRYKHEVHFLDDRLLKRLAKLKSDAEHPNAKEALTNLLPLITQINTAVSEKFNFKPIQNKIIGHIETILFYANVFDLVFKKNKVQLVIGEGMYDTINFGLVLACKKNKIPSLEIQHGVIEDSVYAPYTKDEMYSILPDYIWVWSKRDKQYLEKNSQLSQQLIPIHLGNAWLEKQLSAINKISIEKTKTALKSTYDKIICVTLQPGYPLPNFVVSEMLQQQKNLFLLRKHPNNTEKEITELRIAFENTEHIKFSVESISSLLEAFYISDIHITHSSAAAIEALSLNVSTIIVSEYGQHFFQDYIDKKLMHLALDRSELASLIQTSNKIEAFDTASSNVRVNEKKMHHIIKELIQKCAA